MEVGHRVLNAYRRLRIDHEHSRCIVHRSPLRAQRLPASTNRSHRIHRHSGALRDVLNAYRRLRIDHALKLYHCVNYSECSTPTGVYESITTSGTVSTRFCSRAQRLPASTNDHLESAVRGATFKRCSTPTASTNRSQALIMVATISLTSAQRLPASTNRSHRDRRASRRRDRLCSTPTGVYEIDHGTCRNL